MVDKVMPNQLSSLWMFSAAASMLIVWLESDIAISLVDNNVGGFTTIRFAMVVNESLSRRDEKPSKSLRQIDIHFVVCRLIGN